MRKYNKKEFVAPIVITVLMVLYYIAYFGLIISLLDGIFKLFFGIIPLIFAIIMIAVCIERIKEIKGGKNDDISQY